MMRHSLSFAYGIALFTAPFLNTGSSFQLPHPILCSRQHSGKKSSATALSSYLDSLQQRAVPQPATSFTVTPAAAAAPTSPTSSNQPHQHHQHYYAPLEYFDVQHMKSKGPRATKDWGTPQDATRSLDLANNNDDDGTFFVGAWYCTPGGWPSPTPKALTEIFHVLDGHGALGDADGVMHYFGPGDTVIIPKGHVGRWDVNSAQGIHKVWAVHEHLNIEETQRPIRTQVIHYHQLSPQYLTKGHDALYACTKDASSCSTVASQIYYDVGPTQVGVWTSGATASSSSISVSSCPYRVSNPYPKQTWFLMLEGVLFITDAATGIAHRCVPGDTVMIPQGWTGYIDVVEPVKKIWATGQVEK